MDEIEAHRELESKGLQPFYQRVVEQLASLDQKAQSMVGMEGLLLALIAVFSSSIPTNNQPVRTATWTAMVLLLGSALCSLLVLRIRYGTTIIAKSKTVEDGMLEFRRWRDHKLKLHRAALMLLAAGLLSLVVVLTIVLL